MRQDLDLIQQIARRLGLDFDYDGPAAVFAEMRAAMPSQAGITWARLEAESAVTYPCPEPDHPGRPVLFDDQFPTADGRARFVPAPYAHADEMPDPDYPLVLLTGRQLEHWHTGAMTRRSRVLDAVEPGPTISLHPDDMAGHGLEPGDRVRLESRRGAVEALVREDDGLLPGQVFMPFAYREAAVNLLTNPALDPWGKIPELKFCAVRLG